MVDSPVPKKRLREGFTTGACAAAAAKAAARVLARGGLLADIETTLPNRRKVTFALARCQRTDDKALCSVIKDAGDDPDCTNHAELVAEVQLKTEPGIELRGGEGVATVTKPGLGLDVGGPAINPVPRKNITEMVLEELAGTPYRGAVVTIHVPGGAEMAKKTINSRLGLLGGISILGTTGIVKPYSTASWKASVVQAIDVAAYRGATAVVLTTGGRTEQAAMKLFGSLPEDNFIQMGDFVGIAVRHAAAKGVPRAIVVGMIGKLAKMAEGLMQTHARQGEVNMEFLADLAAAAGAAEPLQQAIRQANTARHVLELCDQGGFAGLTAIVCQRTTEQLAAYVQNRLEVCTYLVDFDGNLLAQYPRQ
jgi:cobalt-precorrin-5B (C1)-methyltransferase